MEVDVRNGAAGIISSIRFTDGLKLTGSAAAPNIRVENQAGQSQPLCAKADIANLIRALQLASRTWGDENGA